MKHEISNHEKPIEISFCEVLYFFKSSWKTILVASVIGFCIAIIYIVTTPRKYEAIAQIKMASMSSLGAPSPYGIPIEDPASLVSRMQMPTNYDPDVIAACNYEKVSSKILPDSFFFVVSKGLPNIVELKVVAPSKAQASECAQVLIEQVQKLQMKLAQALIEEAKAKLDKDNKQLELARSFIAKYERSNNTLTMSYLAIRDEMNVYLSDRLRTLELINSLERRGAYVISPVYAFESTASPKKSTCLVAGLLAGVLLGVFVAFVHQLWKINSNNRTSIK